MEKYKNFLEKHFDVIAGIVAVLCAVIMFFAIIIEMDTPVDAKELEYHYSQLEAVKQDIASIAKLEDADITMDENGMTVTFNGKYHNLQAYFDENKDYINAKIIDNRIGSNIILSLFLVVAAFGLGYFVGWTLLVVLLIPVLVYAIYSIIVDFKKKYHAKKSE